MESTFITTTVVSAGTVTYGATTTDGHFDGKKAKKSLVRAGLTALASSISSFTIVKVQEHEREKLRERVEEKHSAAYVESMSDEELASALEKLNLLESSIERKEEVKSL